LNIRSLTEEDDDRATAGGPTGWTVQAAPPLLFSDKRKIPQIADIGGHRVSCFAGVLT